MLAYPDENVERRILGHLPAWRTQAERKKAEKLELEASGTHVTSYTASELTARLLLDDNLPVDIAIRTVKHGETPRPLDAEFVADELDKLQERGLASNESGQWTMTRRGFQALTEES